jgi:type VI secretion system protein ImpA
MALDLDSLLAPVSDDAPAGVDLSDDNERFTLDDTFSQSASIDPTAENVEEVRIDWRDIIDRIEAQLKRSKDLWLAIYLCRAGAAWGRLDIVETGMLALEGLLEHYWTTMYPSLEDGVIARINAINSLTQRRSFIIPLERLKVLSDERLGEFTAGDVDRFAKQGSAADGYGFFQSLLEAKGPASLVEAQQKLEIIGIACGRIENVFRTQAQGQVPNLTPVRETIDRFVTSLKSFTGNATAAAAETAPPADGEAPAAVSAPAASGASGAPGRPAEVNSRADVEKMIDLICAYYQREEPSSPVPLVLQRARAWVSMSFMEILQDVAPGSISDAGRVLNLGG